MPESVKDTSQTRSRALATPGPTGNIESNFTNSTITPEALKSFVHQSTLSTPVPAQSANPSPAQSEERSSMADKIALMRAEVKKLRNERGSGSTGTTPKKGSPSTTPQQSSYTQPSSHAQANADQFLASCTPLVHSQSGTHEASTPYMHSSERAGVTPGLQLYTNQSDAHQTAGTTEPNSTKESHNIPANKQHQSHQSSPIITVQPGGTSRELEVIRASRSSMSEHPEHHDSRPANHSTSRDAEMEELMKFLGADDPNRRQRMIESSRKLKQAIKKREALAQEQEAIDEEIRKLKTNFWMETTESTSSFDTSTADGDSLRAYTRSTAASTVDHDTSRSFASSSVPTVGGFAKPQASGVKRRLSTSAESPTSEKSLRTETDRLQVQSEQVNRDGGHNSHSRYPDETQRGRSIQGALRSQIYQPSGNQDYIESEPRAHDTNNIPQDNRPTNVPPPNGNNDTDHSMISQMPLRSGKPGSDREDLRLRESGRLIIDPHTKKVFFHNNMLMFSRFAVLHYQILEL